MTLKDTIAKVIARYRNRQPEVYGDMETRDNYLRSLRRERRIQLEQEEKKRLKAQIAAYNAEQRRQHLYGIGNNILTNNRKTKKRPSRWL